MKIQAAKMIAADPPTVLSISVRDMTNSGFPVKHAGQRRHVAHGSGRLDRLAYAETAPIRNCTSSAPLSSSCSVPQPLYGPPAEFHNGPELFVVASAEPRYACCRHNSASGGTHEGINIHTPSLHIPQSRREALRASGANAGELRRRRQQGANTG